MSGAGEELDPIREARALLASARGLVQELAEEGVCAFERRAAPASDAPPVASRPRTAASPTAQAARAEVAPAGRGAAPSEPSVPTSPLPIEEHFDWSADSPPSLEEVRTRLGDCTRCELCQGRKSIVFGDGNPDANLMFIGEGPGEQEDLRGLPFVGRAGELLTQMIEKGIGIPRSEVYICNIVKCRPPRNRNPLPAEVNACRPFLDGQILAVRPKVIVTLGKPAAGLLLDREIAITRVRGTWQEYRGIPLMPTLHPAYLLRQYTPENRRAVWQDLKSAFERTRA